MRQKAMGGKEVITDSIGKRVESLVFATCLMGLAIAGIADTTSHQAVCHPSGAFFKRDSNTWTNDDSTLRVRFVEGASGSKIYYQFYDSSISSWVTLAYCPPGHIWSVATGWADNWPTHWTHLGIDSIEQIDSKHLKVRSAKTIEGHPWEFEDIYSFENGLIRIDRAWKHLGNTAQSPVTLGMVVRAPALSDPRVIFPHFILNNNPNAVGNVPHFNYTNGSRALYEEHRFPIPFVHIESATTAKKRRYYTSLMTIPSRVVDGHKMNDPVLGDEHWWSLGGEYGNGWVDLVSYSGAVASNGRNGVVWGSVPGVQGWHSYPNAYIDVPAGTVKYSKTYFIDIGKVKKVGCGFANTLWKADKVFGCPQAKKRFDISTVLELKTNYCNTLYRATPEKEYGFYYNHRNKEPAFDYGWAGNPLSIEHGFLAESYRRNDPTLRKKAVDSIGFFVNHNMTATPGIFYCHYNYQTNTWSQTHMIKREQAFNGLMDCITIGNKHALDTTSWTNFAKQVGNYLNRKYGGGFTPRDSTGIDFISGLAKLYRVTRDKSYLDTAETMLQIFYKYNCQDFSQPFWGTCLDSDCEEGNSAARFLEACLFLYEATGNSNYLQWAEQVAQWELLFYYFWDTGFKKGSDADIYGINTVSWWVASAQNHHLDNGGPRMAPSFVKLADYLKKPKYKRLGLSMFNAATQGTASPGNMMMFAIKGEQVEQIYQTNWSSLSLGVENWRGKLSDRGKTTHVPGHALYGGTLLLDLLSQRSGCNPEEAIWNDEFPDLNSRWDWNYNKGTGYKRLTKIDGASVVEIGITDQSSSSSYSDCSLHEKSYQYQNGVFEARLRYAGDHKFGTIGWGVWNYEDTDRAEAAWFWDSSSGGKATGFQAMVAYDSAIKFQKHLPEIDIQKWHIYRIDLLPTGVRFFVDGDEVAFTSKRPGKLQRFEIWVDNYRVQMIDGKLSPVGHLNMQQDQRIYIDWVKYYEKL